jgi:hypothetical protein
MNPRTCLVRRPRAVARGAALLIAASLCPAAAQADTPTANTTLQAPAWAVTYGTQAEVDAGTRDCLTGDVCVKLIVHCAPIPSVSAIPPRYRPANPTPDVLIRIKSPSAVNFPDGPIGGVILNTGGGSSSFYGGSTEPTGAHYLVYASRTVDNLNLAGYQTFETRWLEAPSTGLNRTGRGIFAGAEGYGGEKMMCGASEVAEWLSLNHTPTDVNLAHQRLCATGNSGGGMQIAYALSAYRAGRYIKTALFSGGPSWTSVHGLCFESAYQNGRLPNGDVDPLTPQSLTAGSHDSYGREQMEIALDLPVNPNGNPNYGSSYCSVGESPDLIADLGQAAYDFLISSSLEQNGINSPTRYFTLPGVLKIFVSGELDFTGAKVQGDRYKSAILNSGGAVLEDHVLDAGDGNLDYLQHEIQNTDSGALEIELNLTTGTRCTYSPVS